MQFDLIFSQGSNAQPISVEVGDVRYGTMWPVQSADSAGDYSITMPMLSALYQEQSISVELDFNLHNFQLVIRMPSGESVKAQESSGELELRRYLLRTLILKWREEQETDPLSPIALTIYRRAQDEVRRLEVH